MKNFLLLLGLFILTATGYADSAINLHTFDPGRDDLSMNFLGQIFGTVGTVVQGSSGQMLGVVFKVLNEAFVIVAGLWLFYTVLTVVMRSATEGSLMGQGKNTLFIFLRVAFGIGLLLPLPGSGYSAFQEVVMFVVKQSVGVANQTWDAALDYIQIGGSIYTPPDETNSMMDTKNLDQIKKIVSAAACSSFHYNYQKQIEDGQNNVVSDKNVFSPSSILQPITPYIDGNTMKFPDTPGVRNDACGSFSWDSNNTAYTIIQKEAVQQVVNDIEGAATQWGQVKAEDMFGKATDADKSAADSDMVASMTSANIDYANLTLPLRQQIANAMDGARMNFIKNAKQDGWMFAGRYYWSMLTAMTPLHVATTQSPGVSKSTSTPDFHGVSFSDLDPLSLHASSYTDQIKSQLRQYDKASSSGGQFYDETGLGTAIPGVVGTILKMVFGGFGGLMSDMMMVSQNPIFWLHNIGVDCMEIFVQVWIGGALAVMAPALLANLCDAVQPMGETLSVMIGWIKPILFGLCSILLIAGIMLGYYLPLYPYFVFMFGVVGWLITVIETMVAAPMVCLGLTHPEGHDFLGKAEQALMLLLNVFIRPVLMVIGLIAAMILMYVTLRILNAGFIGILIDTTTSFVGTAASHATGFGSILAGNQVPGAGPGAMGVSGAALGPAVFAAATLSGAASLDSNVLMPGMTSAVIIIVLLPMLLLIYAATLYEVVSLVFSLIHVLPDRVGRWIGMQQEQSDTPQRIGQVKGHLSQSTGNVLSMHQMLQSQQEAEKAFNDFHKKDREISASSSNGQTNAAQAPAAGESAAGASSSGQGKAGVSSSSVSNRASDEGSTPV
ncbi:MAG: hypothetical protein A3F17_05190 [Gammaproteobacteria bacterium RIFCSPHIGHO2_12_FULL_41_15]|nr:MAG: hypothetical protein A3F17_05190 [Gammaproteobacteria bacterium RIFCSPHIGHO2_12_FULL_41_15]